MAIRVLHVAESFVPHAGSVAICLHGLHEALRGAGIESAAIGGGKAGAHLLEANSIGVPDGGGAEPRSAVPRLFDQADMIHVHGWDCVLAEEAASLAHKIGKPYVISPTGMLCDGASRQQGWRQRLRRWLSGTRLVRGAVAVTAVSEYEEHKLRTTHVHPNVVMLPYGIHFAEYEAPGASEHAGAPPESPEDGKDRQRPGAQDSEARDAPASADGDRLLLMLGPIHPAEGIVPLLKAVAELGSLADGWNIALVGEAMGDWQKMLEAAIRRKGGADRVQFAPAPDTQTQRTWLARATVLAAPSLQVRCPVSILQAVAAGVPVLASRQAAPPGLEETVHACEPTRHDIRTALQHWFGLSSEERATLGQRAHDAGRAIFDWPVLVDRYVQLYRSLLQP